jgi:hypothetical protein
VKRSKPEAETTKTDLGATRRRLASFVGTEGYKPDLLARIAGICRKLHDEAQAGSYYLLSDESGPEVEAAVETFVQSCGGSAQAIVRGLPRFPERDRIEAYSPVVRARIVRYGLEKELGRTGKPRAVRKPGLALAAWALLALILLLLAVLVLRR